jgi:hypothetical protein
VGYWSVLMARAAICRPLFGLLGELGGVARDHSARHINRIGGWENPCGPPRWSRWAEWAARSSLAGRRATPVGTVPVLTVGLYIVASLLRGRLTLGGKGPCGFISLISLMK